jgi:hypothetical protein
MKRFNPKPCPEPGDGVHTWFFHAACCAVRAGITDEQAIVEVRSLASDDPPQTIDLGAHRSDSGVRS